MTDPLFHETSCLLSVGCEDFGGIRGFYRKLLNKCEKLYELEIIFLLRCLN